MGQQQLTRLLASAQAGGEMMERDQERREAGEEAKYGAAANLQRRPTALRAVLGPPWSDLSGVTDSSALSTWGEEWPGPGERGPPG